MQSWVPPNGECPPPKPGEPELHRAARLGDHERIRALVAVGADINELFDMELDPGAWPSTCSPLMVAAGSGYGASVETVELLLALGASVEPAPGLSPLLYACLGLGWNYPPGGDAARVSALLAAGADPSAVGPNGATALARAAESADAERVRLLLRAGADPMPSCVEVHGGHPWLMPFRDPLCMAAEHGPIESVRLLIEAGVDLGRYSDTDGSPLFLAASLEIFEALLAAGADPLHGGIPTGAIGHVAANEDVPVAERVAMVGALQRAGADINGRASRSSPLFGAALAGDDQGVEVLLRAGADVFVRPTPLQALCFSASHEPDPRIEGILDLLIAAGLDPNGEDDAGLRPLHAALAPDRFGPGYEESDGFGEAAALALLRAGVDIDIVDPRTGHRPLHAAAVAGSLRVIQALLKIGANANETTPDGQTPADLARQVGAHDCVQALNMG